MCSHRWHVVFRLGSWLWSDRNASHLDLLDSSLCYWMFSYLFYGYSSSLSFSYNWAKSRLLKPPNGESINGLWYELMLLYTAGMSSFNVSHPCVCPPGDRADCKQTWLPTRVRRLRLVQAPVKLPRTSPTGQWHQGLVNVHLRSRRPFDLKGRSSFISNSPFSLSSTYSQSGPDSRRFFLRVWSCIPDLGTIHPGLWGTEPELVLACWELTVSSWERKTNVGNDMWYLDCSFVQFIILSDVARLWSPLNQNDHFSSRRSGKKRFLLQSLHLTAGKLYSVFTLWHRFVMVPRLFSPSRDLL